MSLESCVDVLIIGAGPAGLMCANALAMAGIDVRIIERRPTKLTVGQADGIQSRTIESYGLAGRLIREGNQVYMSAFYGPNERGEIECTRRERLVTPPTACFPFIITLHQGAIESILLDSMSRHGVKMDQPVAPSAIEVSEDTEELANMSSYPVKVTLERLDAVGDATKTESVRAKFVIGADGAHSWVRKALNIAMEGEHTDAIWGVIDMIPDTDFPDIRKLTKIQSTNGTCMIIPREDEKVRLYIQLSEADVPFDPSTGRVDKSRMRPEKLFEVVRKMFRPFELRTSGFEWWTIYIVGQRIASSYSVRERVFIAGDACHTHSPKAGQGMNASMNDSHNLAWKLAQVLRGWASPSLLKTYELERRQFAQDLITFDKEYSVLFSGKPRTGDNPNGLSHENFVRVSEKFGSLITGIGVQYAPSSLVNVKHQGCASNLVIGQRMLPQIFVRAADALPIEIQDMLPADVRFKILIFTGILTDTQISNVNSLAMQLGKPSSFLQKYTKHGNVWSLFDIITIVAGRKEEANFLDVPPLFRQHWSKVLLDDVDVTQRRGGCGYETFGIDPTAITFVVVRPDGYVGMVAPSPALDDVDSYFSSFLIPRGLFSS
ncbi:hypothetical protein PAXRUDRAFT_136127 [Paxillus rubicundulus Ve08.2h10]|uniref:Phenol 2-monooxygenase n=1 Tax=Paxillus rubicundulus Ve08.2h10 TaxID=930991 RepID=A0A0D0E7A8_9AGAM|nr:hypothetical protein PAXRUDRAFT_136127 [Paxillus rubicundulus Ve08.2h10]